MRFGIWYIDYMRKTGRLRTGPDYLDVICRIYGPAIDMDFKVAVRSGASSGVADKTDNLTLVYLVACRNVQLAAMCIQGLRVRSVIDYYHVSVI